MDHNDKLKFLKDTITAAEDSMNTQKGTLSDFQGLLVSIKIFKEIAQDYENFINKGKL